MRDGFKVKKENAQELSMKKIIIFAAVATLISFPSVTFAQGSDGSSGDTETSARENDPSQRIRCKRFAVTGSLVKKQRVCRTVAEWQEISENGNRYAKDIVDTANQGFTNGK